MVCIKKQPYIYYVRLTFKNRHFFRYLTCLLDRGHIIRRVVMIMKLTYEDKVGLTLACLNNKKLVKMIVGKICYFIQISQFYWILRELSVNIKKTIIKNDVCLHSEIMTESLLLCSCRRLGLYPLFPKIFGEIHLLLGKT